MPSEAAVLPAVVPKPNNVSEMYAINTAKPRVFPALVILVTLTTTPTATRAQQASSSAMQAAAAQAPPPPPPPSPAVAPEAAGHNNWAGFGNQQSLAPSNPALLASGSIISGTSSVVQQQQQPGAALSPIPAAAGPPQIPALQLPNAPSQIQVPAQANPGGGTGNPRFPNSQLRLAPSQASPSQATLDALNSVRKLNPPIPEQQIMPNPGNQPNSSKLIPVHSESHQQIASSSGRKALNPNLGNLGFLKTSQAIASPSAAGFGPPVPTEKVAALVQATTENAFVVTRQAPNVASVDDIGSLLESSTVSSVGDDSATFVTIGQDVASFMLAAGRNAALNSTGNSTENSVPENGCWNADGYSDRPFLEIRGDSAQLIVLSRMRSGTRCVDHDRRKESLAEVMRWTVDRMNSQVADVIGNGARSETKFGLSVYDTCGMRDDSAVTVAMAAISREARLRTRTNVPIAAFPLGFFIAEPGDEELLRPVLSNGFEFPYVNPVDWRMREALLGAAHLLMTWGRFPPVVLLTQDPRALAVFLDAADTFGLCLRATVFFPHADDCRTRNPLEELRSYYGEERRPGPSPAAFLEDEHSSVWIIHGSSDFVTRCVSRYWGVVANGGDLGNLVIAARHPSTSNHGFVPIIKLVQTTEPKLSENANSIRQSASFNKSVGNASANAVVSGNDVATTVSSTLAALRKLESAGVNNCWQQQRTGSFRQQAEKSDIRSHFPLPDMTRDNRQLLSGAVLGSPLPDGIIVSTKKSDEDKRATKCEKFLKEAQQLAPKMFDIPDSFLNSRNESVRLQPATYRFSVLRKRQGLPEWEDFARYSSRDLTLFGEKVQYMLGLPKWIPPKHPSADVSQATCLNYELKHAGTVAAPLTITLATWSSVCLTAAVMGVLCCLSLMLFFYYRLCFRSRAEPHYGYPLVLLFSVICLYCSVVPFVLDANDLICRFRMFAAGVGYALPFSTMLARQAMLATASAHHISGVVQLMLCGFAFGIQCCVAVETWVLKPSGLVVAWDPSRGRVAECGHSASEILVASTYVAFLLGCLLVVGPAAATKKRNFREGLYLCVASWAVAAVWITWCALLALYPNWTRLIVSAGMTSSATIILVVVYAPKLCFIMTHSLTFSEEPADGKRIVGIPRIGNANIKGQKRHHSNSPSSLGKYCPDNEMTMTRSIGDDDTATEIVHATNLAVLNRAFASDMENGGFGSSNTRKNRRMCRAESVETAGTMLSGVTRTSAPRICEFGPPGDISNYGTYVEDEPTVHTEHLRRADHSDRQNSVPVGRVLKI